MPTVEERLSVLEREHIEFKRHFATHDGQFQFIVGQLRDLQNYMHARFEQVDGNFLRVDSRFDQVDRESEQTEARVGRVELEVRRLREDMPGIVAEAMRGVLREGSRGLRRLLQANDRRTRDLRK